MQKVYLRSSFTKCNENCGLPDLSTDYQIRHLGNPSGLPEILPKIDPCSLSVMSEPRFLNLPYSRMSLSCSPRLCKNSAVPCPEGRTPGREAPEARGSQRWLQQIDPTSCFQGVRYTPESPKNFKMADATRHRMNCG